MMWITVAWVYVLNVLFAHAVHSQVYLYLAKTIDGCNPKTCDLILSKKNDIRSTFVSLGNGEPITLAPERSQHKYLVKSGGSYTSCPPGYKAGALCQLTDPCPSEGKEYLNSSNTCFKMLEGSFTFFEAYNKCKEIGCDLASENISSFSSKDGIGRWVAYAKIERFNGSEEEMPQIQSDLDGFIHCRCVMTANKSSEWSTWIVIVIVVVAFIVFIAICLLIYCFRKQVGRTLRRCPNVKICGDDVKDAGNIINNEQMNGFSENDKNDDKESPERCCKISIFGCIVSSTTFPIKPLLNSDDK